MQVKNMYVFFYVQIPYKFIYFLLEISLYNVLETKAYLITL